MNHHSGFTLIELIVAASLGVIVIMGGMRLLNNLHASQQTAKKIAEVLNTTEPIFNQLTQDIRWSASYDLNQNTLLLFDQNNQPLASYRQIQKTLYRNNDPLTGPHIELTQFNIINRAPPDELPLMEISLGLKHLSPLGSDTTINTKTSISMRQSTEPKP